jgi:hypothetical protein
MIFRYFQLDFKSFEKPVINGDHWFSTSCYIHVVSLDILQLKYTCIYNIELSQQEEEHSLYPYECRLC